VQSFNKKKEKIEYYIYNFSETFPKVIQNLVNLYRIYYLLFVKFR